MRSLYIFILLIFIPYSAFAGAAKDVKDTIVYANTLRAAVKVGKNMHKLIATGEKDDYVKCIRIMNEMRPKVEKLYFMADNIPLQDAKYTLGLAAYHTSMCVNCLPTDNCKKAESFIKDGLKEIEMFRQATRKPR